MTKVTIRCPITWYEQCDWIKHNCKNYTDITNWGLWQISQDDIYFLLEDADAMWFVMRWA